MANANLIPGIIPGKTIEFTYEGDVLSGFEGEGIASALMRAGHRATWVTSQTMENRGYYCGMGLCWECVVEVAGIGFVRGCQHPVRAGLVVRMAKVRTEKDR